MQPKNEQQIGGGQLQIRNVVEQQIIVQIEINKQMTPLLTLIVANLEPDFIADK